MPKEAKDLKDFILTQKENIPRKVEIYTLGPVLGTHIGPYALSI